MLTTHPKGSFESGASAPAWLGKAKTATPDSILHAPVTTLLLAGREAADRDCRAQEEFDHRRRKAIASTRDCPTQRVAAFLAATSRLNDYEGRDPDRISDLLPSGIVADLLDIDVETLACALVELERCNLIAPCDDGWLRLLDRGRLEAFIPASAPPRRDDCGAWEGSS